MNYTKNTLKKFTQTQERIDTRSEGLEPSALGFGNLRSTS